MINATIEKFGYPATLVKEYRHWLVLLRPAQVTAGSLILAAKSDAAAFGDLQSGAFVELQQAVTEIEMTLRETVAYEKINYLMLMMVDPHVHFHVFPRYSGSRSIGGLEFHDSGWPGPPDLKSAVALGENDVSSLRQALISGWRSSQTNSG
jgi:diadenosine tetraphosphate (Ap4A) HIT family hydrolase